ncbi:hypothetical protein BI350_06005 [Sporosarcina ureilytica]|uniref:DUF2269 domain-containing protein n=2 Tax=Sporosarcina ureilytica TaxID=298596 RepID=A0A1D8JK82_9BACL|nr:hypothetical protein BI350_06005 [Sporosarcina ureilytica]
MFDYYTTLVFLHVTSAVFAIGPLFIIIPIINRIRNEVEVNEKIYLSIIRVIIRIVMHAGHLLVTTGVLLILFGPWPWHTSWVVMTVVVMGITAVFLASGFSKVLREFGEPHANKQYILKRLTFTTWIYIGLMLLLLWLMVQKPSFW